MLCVCDPKTDKCLLKVYGSVDSVSGNAWVCAGVPLISSTISKWINALLELWINVCVYHGAMMHRLTYAYFQYSVSG